MADSELRRTHPYTVLVRSARSLGQAVAGFFALTVVSMANQGSLAMIGFGAFVLVIGAITAGFSWLSWSYFYYGVVGNDLIINEGWLVKKHRSIPLARVQGVDIRAPLISRLMGLADVVVQTAGGGGGEAEARIGSIPLSDAEKLRAQLISGRAQPASAVPAAATTGAAAAASTSPDATAQAPFGPPTTGSDPLGHLSDFRGVLGGTQHADTEPVFEHAVPLPTLVLAAITSNGPVIALLATVGVAGQGFELLGGGSTDAATSLASRLALPALIAAGLMVFLFVGASAIVVTVARDFGFTIRRTGQRLETEAGLTERRMTSVPVRRIQAIVVESTPLRRMLKLSSVRLHTAGFGQSDQEQQSASSRSLIPLARSKDVRPLLHRLLPEAEQFPHSQSVPHRALRFYVLLPTVLASLLTLAVLGVPLALNAAAQLSEELMLATPLILAAGIFVVAGVVFWLRLTMYHAAGFGIDAQAIAVTYGSLGRYRARIARSRIQSLSIRQSPFQRRAGLVTLSVAAVSGSSQTVFRVRHMGIAEAVAIENWYSPDARV